MLLASPQPEIKHDGYTFRGGLLLHHLLITGKGEKILRRRLELNQSLLEHTCKCSTSKVGYSKSN